MRALNRGKRMRFAVAALTAAFALASSAFANNIALSSLGATATCGGIITLPDYPNLCYLIYPYPSGTDYSSSNPIDGDQGTEWVAPGGTQDPTLLIDLGGLYTVDDVTIEGVGNPGNSIGFSVYVGTSSDLATLEAGTPIGTVPSQLGGTPWTDGFSVSTSSPIQYVLYDVTTSNPNPTVGLGGSDGLDDAYASTILVDEAPEMGTFGLMAAGLLAWGFIRHSRP